MTPSDKVDAVTGVVAISLGAVSGTFSPEDFRLWGTTFMSMSPFVLVLFLIWRIRQLDAQHKECTANQIKTQEQVLLAFRAVQDSQVRRNLPSEDDFKDGNFCLDKLIRKEK
jgi:hypothetical protein